MLSSGIEEVIVGWRRNSVVGEYRRHAIKRAIEFATAAPLSYIILQLKRSLLGTIFTE